MSAEPGHDPLAALAQHRFEYETAGLDVGDVDGDPLVQWQRWFREASEAGCTEPHAFVLGTVDADGWPQTRYILLRAADERGFSFFTNYLSAKSQQMEAEPQVSLLFTWLQLHRQVRILGTVARVPEADSDDYFASRPRGSQVGAWSSPQSQPIPDRAWLEQRVEQMAATFGDAPVPRPAFWGGWGCSRWRTSSGRAAPAACTTACATPGTAADGSWALHRLALKRPERASPVGPGGGRSRQAVDQGLRMRHQARALPVLPDRAGAAHAGWQLDLHAALARQVHRVVRVQAAQLLGHGLEVGLDRVVGQGGAQVCGHMARQFAVLAAEEQGGPEAMAPVAVDRDHQLHVLQEGGQRRRFRRRHLVRRDVPQQVLRLQDAVVAGATACRGRVGDDVREVLQRAAVVRHETEPPFQAAHLAHPRAGQQVAQRGGGHSPPSEAAAGCWRRHMLRPIAAATTTHAATTTAVWLRWMKFDSSSCHPPTPLTNSSL